MQQHRYGATNRDWDTLSVLAGLTEDLLPVVCNPKATLSPDSKIKEPGKLPSIYNSRKQLVGLSGWTQRRTSDKEIKDWAANPDYGIGIQCREVRAIDVDVTDPDLAASISDAIQAALGSDLPTRSRANSSKFLVAFTLPGNYSKRVMNTKHGRIEFLANGQHFVAIGTHPSGVPYSWNTTPDDFPVISADKFEWLWGVLEARFAVAPSTESTASVRAEKLQQSAHNDPVAKHLIDNNYVVSTQNTGQLNIRCPFEGGHSSDTGERQTVYWPAHTGGYINGHFHCLHASCEHRTDEDFKDAIGYHEFIDEFPDLTVVQDATIEAELVTTEMEKAPKFKREPIEQFIDRPPLKWRIKNILPDAELCVLYGEPTAGKTFAAIDMAMSIAKGIDWFGNRTKQGKVVYVAAEGGGGMSKRFKAYVQGKGLDAAKIEVICAAPNLLDRKESIELAKAIGPAAVVFIDTLAQCMPGANENASEHMGLAISHLKGIHKATGAMIVAIHHSGKDVSRGARGWSGLRAAVDAELELRKVGKVRILRTSKLKDAEDDTQYAFELCSVPVGQDEDGDTISSCYINQVDLPSVKVAVRLTEWEQFAMDELAKILPKDGSGLASDYVASELASLKKPPEKGKRDSRKQLSKRAIKGLIDKGLLYEDGDGFVHYVLMDDSEADDG